MSVIPRAHGGPDALGAARYDFSTNSNACGPCPQALVALQSVDATRYPDASYTALRAALAEFHDVDAWRVVLAGSASEFIFRISAWARQQGGRTVSLPTHAYGDYAHAAQAWDLQLTPDVNTADLVWACEPSSPLGQAHADWPHALGTRSNSEISAGKAPLLVLDRAYAPLRLEGEDSLSAAQLSRVWQLFSPNKALGLTGVRAAYALAPLQAQHAAAQMDALAPSWVVGAHGVALLMAWTQAAPQDWLQSSLQTLRVWKRQQIQGLQALGWHCLPSDTPFFCARPTEPPPLGDLLAALRAQGIQLRDATSFGLPGCVRLGVLPPQAQAALLSALTTAGSPETKTSDTAFS